MQILCDNVPRRRHYSRKIRGAWPRKGLNSTMAERFLMKGNEALAEAAIQAGCKHFFGYPITPQTELAAYMSKRMPKIGGTYLQA